MSRRRDVRFELTDFLIAHNLLDRARSELLVAAGNARRTTSAFSWRSLARWSKRRTRAMPCTSTKPFSTVTPSLREALEGAGRTAYQLGRFLEAKRILGTSWRAPGWTRNPKLCSDRVAAI